MTKRQAARLPQRGVVAVEGPEARPFLQNLITQDMDLVGPDRAAYGALLTPQGRFLHDFLILAAGDGFLLECERARAGDLAERLGRYRLRSKVAVAERSAPWAAWALWGDGAAAALGLGAEPGGLRRIDGGCVFVDPRLAALGARALLPAGDDGRALLAAGFAPADAAAYDRHRLALAVPDGSRDLEIERTTAAEGNLDRLGAVAWDKGCYVGQELTARLRYRGLVKRRLVPVAIDGPTPPPGTPILAGAEEAGVLRSAADGLGLALLRLEARDGLTAGGARLAPLPWPWGETSGSEVSGGEAPESAAN